MIFQFRQFLLCLLFLSPLATLPGQEQRTEPFRPETVQVVDDIDSWIMGFDRVGILEDAGKKLKIEEVLSPEGRGSFVPAEKAIPNFGFSSSVYWFWIRLDIKEARDWYLEVAYPILDYLDLYIVDPVTGRIHSEHRSGDRLPFSVREVRHRYFVFKLPEEEGKTWDLFLRVETESTKMVPITVWQREALAEKDSREEALIWLFYGVLLVMIVYNSFLYFSLRDLSYLYYTLYISVFGIYVSGLNGIAYRFFWPDAPWWNSHGVVAVSGVTTALGIVFVRRFLGTQKNPRFDIFLWILTGLCVIQIVYSFIDVPMATRFIAILGPVSYFAFFGAGVMALWRGYNPARFFLIAWVALIASIFIHAFRSAGIVPGNIFTVNSIQLGSVVEMILLSLALADRINAIQKEKQQAQEEAIALKDQNVENLKRLNKSYSRFVPEELLQFLAKDSIEDVRLGDQIQRDMSVMFVDIRAFTSLSEKMTPKENFDFLNSYLRRVGPHIREYGGIIDKYIGDAMMALFPGSVAQPIQAAITIQETVRSYNEYRVARGYKAIEVGVGIHTGTLMLGIVGEHKRMEGTVISDTVNISSRLEGLTKIYGAPIVISGPSLFSLGADTTFNHRFLGFVQVKGKDEPVAVYEILDGDIPEHSQLKIAQRGDFERAVQYYLDQEFEEATNMMTRMFLENPHDRALQYYRNRCLFFSRHGVQSDWKGTEIMDMK